MEHPDHLPIYGVGPFYGAGVIGSAVVGIILALLGLLDSGSVPSGPLSWVFLILGVLTALAGLLIWLPAAVGKGSIDGYIQSNTLCTTGVYSIVRNPCYSGIMLMCTGGLLLARNFWLLLLPPLYWLSMTVLMKCSEEKWLLQLYGQPYLDYCKRVNRCIPWFPKK